MPVLHAEQALQYQVKAAVRILKSGGVVAIPTDTLYGLAADALDENAVKRIFSIKGRSKEMALPLLLADADDIVKWAVDIPDTAWLVARRQILRLGGLGVSELTLAVPNDMELTAVG